jgi:hypothetical protein
MIDEHSISQREHQWKHLLRQNIGWIAVVASIWLTHFLR